MESIQSIKARIKTVKSIQKAANAMKLISSIKLSKLNKNSVASSSDYLKEMLEFLIAEGIYNNPSALPAITDKPAVIVLTSNQGFCGAFKQAINNKADELISSLQDPEVVHIIPNLSQDLPDILKSKLREIYIVSGKYINILKQEASYKKILPIEKKDFRSFTKLRYSGNFRELFSFVLEKYLKSVWSEIVYQHLLSELSIRVMSTDKMYRNADDMSKELDLLYNRTRQAKITQELTEIVSSVECLQ